MEYQHFDKHYEYDGDHRANKHHHHHNHYHHHQQPTKRRRRNQKQQQAAGIRDCYEEATTSTPKMRHDWFFAIPRISRESIQHHHHRHNNSNNRMNPSTSLSENSDNISLQAELESLDIQLRQVKEKFRTASERCSNAVVASSPRSRTSPSQEFEQARRNCNPYEPLGETRAGGLNHGLFINRSAIKLSNIDAVLKFTLTPPAPSTDNNHSSNDNNNGSGSGNGTFYFVDLCGAPGGFSEYLLRRCCHSITHCNSLVGARGYGMSLVGNNAQGHGMEWKLSQGPMLMSSKNKSTQEERPGVSYQICLGHDGTGDIMKWENIQSLQQKIAVAQNSPQGAQVPLVCADGGVDAQRNLAHQESATERLVVYQVAAALSLLQPGKSSRFILKLLSCQSTIILKRVMQVLYDSFDTLQLLKPISSRPASAERYLVCTGFRPQPSSQQFGPGWIDCIMTMDDNNSNNSIGGGGSAIQLNPELMAFLARVDRDMMHLNLRACFAILSHMESKTTRLLSMPKPSDMTPSLMHGTMGGSNNNATGDSDDAMDEDEKEEDDAWITQGYHQFWQQQQQQGGRRKKKVNVNAYKRAWKLF